jgi:NCS1 family nucleobase:cation symporter-1
LPENKASDNRWTAGLVATVNGYTGSQWTGWIRLYNLTFLVGLAISFVVFIALSYFFPVPGLGIDVPFIENYDVIDGRSTPQGSDRVEVEATLKA